MLTPLINFSLSRAAPNTGEFFISSDTMATLPAAPATATPGTSTLSVGISSQADLTS